MCTKLQSEGQPKTEESDDEHLAMTGEGNSERDGEEMLEDSCLTEEHWADHAYLLQEWETLEKALQHLIRKGWIEIQGNKFSMLKKKTPLSHSPLPQLLKNEKQLLETVEKSSVSNLFLGRSELTGRSSL